MHCGHFYCAHSFFRMIFLSLKNNVDSDQMALLPGDGETQAVSAKYLMSLSGHLLQARRKQLQIGGAHINFFTDWGGTHNFF